MKIDERRNFGKRECPSCGVEVDANQNHCPICHYPFPHPTPLQRGFRIGGALLMLGIILFLLLAWLW